MRDYSNPSSNFILVRGTLLTGINNASNPAILIIIETGYIIDSGKTKEYQPKNSPKASSPNPIATDIVLLFLLSKYESIVSIAPYANKINETDLKMCSIWTEDTKNNGSIPIERKYRVFGKNDLILWENAIKK